MSGGQPADASTDHHTIKRLSGGLRSLELAGIKRIAYAVASGHNRMCVAVGCSVVSHAAVAIPVLLGHHRRREWTSIEEISPGHLGIHAERAVRWRALWFWRRKSHAVSPQAMWCYTSTTVL